MSPHETTKNLSLGRIMAIPGGIHALASSRIARDTTHQGRNGLLPRQFR